jgi:hypothetical protein
LWELFGGPVGSMYYNDTKVLPQYSPHAHINNTCQHVDYTVTVTLCDGIHIANAQHSLPTSCNVFNQETSCVCTLSLLLSLP